MKTDEGWLIDGVHIKPSLNSLIWNMISPAIYGRHLALLGDLFKKISEYEFALACRPITADILNSLPYDAWLSVGSKGTIRNSMGEFRLRRRSEDFCVTPETLELILRVA